MKFSTSPHITIYVDLYMYMVYSSACVGPELIRFSYATNILRPQKSGYVQATYKSGTTYTKYHFTP